VGAVLSVLVVAVAWAASADADAGDIARALARRLSSALDFEDDTPPPTERRMMVDAAEAMKTAMLDAVSVDPKQVTVRNVRGRYQLVDRGRHLLRDFGANERAARLVWLVFRTYGVERMCFVGRPDPSFTFLLAGGDTRLSPGDAFYTLTIPGQAPAGNYPEIASSYQNHKTTRFVNDRLALTEFTQETRGKYRIMSGDTVLYAFDDQSEAVASMVFITLYGFNRKHTVYATPTSTEEVFSYLTRDVKTLQVRN